MNCHRPIAASSALTLVLLAGPALAGRPLSVDDADVADKGTGHVEAWVARVPRRTNVVNIAPAYSPWEVVELSALLARNRTQAITSTGFLARIRLTEPRETGCNALVALGHQHDSPGGNLPFAYTAVTCRSAKFALHGNAGAANPSSARSYGTWGIALEHDTGDFIEHVEAFGQEHAKPTFQLGARKQIAAGWQLDGTIGRTDGETIYSLGVKFEF
jgi:hypothetical protein